MTAFFFNPLIDAVLEEPVAGESPAPVSPAEWSLILQTQAGSEAAFRSLVEMHQGLIHRLCAQWLQCGEDASEVCQDTFLRAWQALPAWRPKGKLSTWLCRIALNLCRDRARSRARRQSRVTIPLTSLAETPPCPLVTPDDAAAHAGDMEKLQRGLACLPPPMREVLILCVMEGLSQREAAAILGCSCRAIEGRLHRARLMLLKWWNNQG